jgi:protein CpxP
MRKNILCKRVFALCLLISVVFGWTLRSQAADAANNKDGIAILNQMRVKQVTKALSLTEEQEKKVKALYDDEAARVRTIQGNDALDLNRKFDQQVAVKKETSEKLKALLTEEQKTKFEAMNTKPARKKPAATPAPKP